MKTDPKGIYEEYKKSDDFKNSIGAKGIAEQSKINERFFRGDQWYGAGAGADRPLVRHNVIKRIGEFKMAQILTGNKGISYTVEDLPSLTDDRERVSALKKAVIREGENALSETPDPVELGLIADSLTKHRLLCEKRLQFSNIRAKALKDAYVTGTGIIYTFWDSSAPGGDIGCEVLSVNDVFFADPYEKQVQNQPYIIISGTYDVNRVLREAEKSGFPSLAKTLERDAVRGKIQVLTKLYKEYKENGEYDVMCVRVTESAVIRKPFITGLKYYPICVFCFDEREDIIYGDSEVTYLIPNQIAINRMITANVWSSMSTGMPIMVVNGDCVTADITNDPGQIIKVYGSTEEIKNAVSFVSPSDFSKDFCENINNLIKNTLTQSGATAAVLGDEVLDNATALSYMKNSALMSLEVSKERFAAFLRENAAVWADFFMTCYQKRPLKIKEGKNVYYIPFNAKRYEGVTFLAEDEEEPPAAVTEADERAKFVLSLYEKDVIGKEELLSNLSDLGMINAKKPGDTEAKI